MRSHVVALTAVCLLAACSDSPSEPTVAEIEGVWNYTAEFDDACSEDLTLVLIQDGVGTFRGTYSGLTTCDSDALDLDPFESEGRVVNGVVTGSQIEFDFDSPEFHHFGTVRSRSMSGTAHQFFEVLAEIFPDYNGSNGTWTATR